MVITFVALASCLLFLFAAHDAVEGLKMLELQVPPSIMQGQPITLNCTFDLEGDTLYTIKWYKNNVEFYRYIVGEKPPGQHYNLQGIYLDNKFPHGPSIQMYKTDLTSEGTYRCEVSTEGPIFDTVKDEKELRVYVLPENDPSILGAKTKYSIADDLNVTCMSGPSKPPSFLQWLVNQGEVPEIYITRMAPRRQTNGLLSSMLGLRFVVVPQHLTNGVLTLTCRAYISKAYLTTKSEIVATNKAKIADNYATPSHDGPMITGGRLRYQEGNVVNVNCTAKKSHPPAELRWYINDKEANRDYLRSYLPVRYPDGHEATLLGLRFTVQPRHFQRGEMRLKCMATLFNVTDVRSVDMIISNNRQQEYVVTINTNGVQEIETERILVWILTFLVVLACCR